MYVLNYFSACSSMLKRRKEKRDREIVHTSKQARNYKKNVGIKLIMQIVLLKSLIVSS